MHFFAQRRATSAEDDELRIEIEIVDVVQMKKTVDRFSFFINQRQHQPGELRLLRIDITMCGKVNDAVRPQIVIDDGALRSGEIEILARLRTGDFSDRLR